MTDERQSDLLSSLPRTRPHRRSEKRPSRPVPAEAPAAATTLAEAKQSAATKQSAPKQSAPAKQLATAEKRKPRRLEQPAQPAGTPSRTGAGRRSGSTKGRPAPQRPRQASQPAGVPLVSTAVQAAAELAEIGLSLGTRALRGAVGRLPRP